MRSCTSPTPCGRTSMRPRWMPRLPGTRAVNVDSAGPAPRWRTPPETMLAQRVITAVVLLLILAGAAVLGPAAVLALGAVILGLACFEWLRLAGLASPGWWLLGIVFAVLALSGAWFGSLTAAAATWILVGAAAAWLGIAALLFRHEADGARLPRWLIV